MSELLLVGKGVLVATFTASGIAKLSHPEATSAAMIRFRLVTQASPLLARLLGAVEVLLAAALVVSPDEPVPLVMAALLLMTFAVMIAGALRRGDSFSCACFGQSDRPISPSTLLRTSILLALTVLLLIAGPGEANDVTQRLSGALIGGLVICSVALVAELLHSKPFTTSLPRTEAISSGSATDS